MQQLDLVEMWLLKKDFDRRLYAEPEAGFYIYHISTCTLWKGKTINGTFDTEDDHCKDDLMF